MSVAPLHEFTSHIAGKNAKVRIYTDHIEWDNPGKIRMMGVATFGTVSALRRKGAGTEIMPIRAVTSVTTKKNVVHTQLTIIASGNTIEANIGHEEAEKVKATLLRLMNS